MNLQCYKGYPSCMQVESGGSSCKKECAAKINVEINKLRIKQQKMNERHMQRYRDGTASRALTTTHNARSTWINQEIESLKNRSA